MQGESPRESRREEIRTPQLPRAQVKALCDARPNAAVARRGLRASDHRSKIRGLTLGQTAELLAISRRFAKRANGLDTNAVERLGAFLRVRTRIHPGQQNERILILN